MTGTNRVRRPAVLDDWTGSFTQQKKIVQTRTCEIDVQLLPAATQWRTEAEECEVKNYQSQRAEDGTIQTLTAMQRKWKIMVLWSWGLGTTTSQKVWFFIPQILFLAAQSTHCGRFKDKKSDTIWCYVSFGALFFVIAQKPWANYSFLTFISDN